MSETNRGVGDGSVAEEGEVIVRRRQERDRKRKETEVGDEKEKDPEEKWTR